MIGHGDEKETKNDSTRSQMQKTSAGTFHNVLPDLVPDE
jgi:hypothetical protein